MDKGNNYSVLGGGGWCWLNIFIPTVNVFRFFHKQISNEPSNSFLCITGDSINIKISYYAKINWSNLDLSLTVLFDNKFSENEKYFLFFIDQPQ